MKWGSATYLALFIYIIVAIVFWGTSLQKQNKIIAAQELKLMQYQVNSLGSLIDKEVEERKILERKSNRTLQYIGEGAVFLIIVFFAAYVVYSNIQKRKKFADLQNNFMLSVTHELKSPIAGVKLNLQTLKRPNLPEDKKELLIQRSIHESDRLNDLCNNLLLASQMEGKRAIFNQEKINFSLLCKQCIEDYSNRSTHQIIQAIDPDLYTFGDLMMWKIAINNLLENAIKYSDNNAFISIALHAEDEAIILQVADQGIGIADDEKSKIFNKFYRIGNENSRTTKGTGLGLFLTAAIIRQHESSILVKDNTPKGSVFEILIPKHKV